MISSFLGSSRNTEAQLKSLVGYTVTRFCGVDDDGFLSFYIDKPDCVGYKLSIESNGKLYLDPLED